MTHSLRENRTAGAILLNILLAAVSFFVNGFGIHLTIRANIGAAPWDVLNLGLSTYTCKDSPTSVGGEMNCMRELRALVSRAPSVACHSRI